MQAALLQSVLSTGVTLAAKVVTSVVGQMPATYHADLMERPDLVQWNPELLREVDHIFEACAPAHRADLLDAVARLRDASASDARGATWVIRRAAKELEALVQRVVEEMARAPDVPTRHVAYVQLDVVPRIAAALEDLECNHMLSVLV
jgi:predicted RNA-binding Zn ribbon-like protein